MGKRLHLISIVLLLLLVVSGCRTDDSSQTERFEEMEGIIAEREDKFKKRESELIERIEELEARVKKLEKPAEELAEEPAKEPAEEPDEVVTEKTPVKYDMELNPNQEGFYNDVYYSGETGMAGPDEYHTVEEASAMGYDVVVITRPANSDLPLIEGLDKPYPYDRFIKDSIINHVDGNVFEMDGEYIEFLYTAIQEEQGSFRAYFQYEDGFVFGMGY